MQTGTWMGLISRVALTASLSCALVLPLTSHAAVAGGRAELGLENRLTLDLISDAVNVPWGMTVLPSGDLLVTERSGTVFRIKPTGESEMVSGVPPVWARGQGGLLDVAVHPEFDRDPWVYFSYSKPMSGGSHTAIARAKLNGNSLDQWSELYSGNNPTSKKQHFGSRLVLHDGYLFFSVGDRGARDVNPQNLSRDGGKIYRLHDDGRIPTDNPFVDTDGAVPAVWSYGHRNPQGMAIDKNTGALWAHEHGPRGGDELNLVKSGANYGWPLATFGINYWGTRITNKTALEGMVSPAWHWTPSIAPSGMAVVDGSRYSSLGDGLLIGSLKFGELHFRPTATAAATPMRVVLNDLGRVRSLTTGADGTVYVGITGEGVFRLLQR